MIAFSILFCLVIELFSSNIFILFCNCHIVKLYLYFIVLEIKYYGIVITLILRNSHKEIVISRLIKADGRIRLRSSIIGAGGGVIAYSSISLSTCLRSIELSWVSFPRPNDFCSSACHLNKTLGSIGSRTRSSFCGYKIWDYRMSFVCNHRCNIHYKYKTISRKLRYCNCFCIASILTNLFCNICNDKNIDKKWSYCFTSQFLIFSQQWMTSVSNVNLINYNLEWLAFIWLNSTSIKIIWIFYLYSNIVYLINWII